MAANKRVGKKSLAQNDYLFPSAPLIGTATNVGTGRAYNDGAATVTFTPQGPNAATSYTVTSYPGGLTATGSESPLTVEGLTSALDYEFEVTATNSYGTSAPSGRSNNILVTTVPATPATPTTESPAPGLDRVTWTAPANGGTAITNYYWVASDGKTGNTTSTTVDVNQEQGSAQTYNVRADNANGSSVTSPESNSVTTTFSFAPFGAFGFSPFAAFGFSPFAAFGFSPFGFSPFGAFGFSPFGFSPFGFSPYSPPRCIAGDTEIAAVDADGKLTLVKAKDIRVGDKVFSPIWDEFDGAPSPYESRIEYDVLTNKRIGIGEIEHVLEKKTEESIIFNSNKKKHFSLTQPILARKEGGKDAWEFAGDLVAGDIIWEYNFETESYDEVKIQDIHIEKTEIDVFQISVKGIDTFIAGGVVAHNK